MQDTSKLSTIILGFHKKYWSKSMVRQAGSSSARGGAGLLADLLILLGGDFLQEVRDRLALRHEEAQALEMAHHILSRAMKYHITCVPTQHCVTCLSRYCRTQQCSYKPATVQPGCACTQLAVASLLSCCYIQKLATWDSAGRPQQEECLAFECNIGLPSDSSMMSSNRW